MSRKKHKKQNQVQQNILKEEETKVEEQPVVEGPVLEEEKEAPLVIGEKETNTSEIISNSATKSVEQTKNTISKKNIILLLIVVICIVAILFGVKQLNKKKPVENPTNNNTPNTNEEEAPQEWDESVSPPKDAEIIDISSFGKESIKLSIRCLRDVGYYSDTSNNITRSGDSIKCSYDINAVEGFKIDTVFLELNYGSELEFQNIEYLDEENTTIKDNRIKDVISSPTNTILGNFKYVLKVKDISSPENLFIEAKNIIIKTIKNDYYRLENVKIDFIVPSQEYSIYKVTDEYNDSYIGAYNYNIEKMDPSNQYTLLDKYKCKEKECVFKDLSGDYALFADDGFVAYNYVTKEETYILDFDTTTDIGLVADSKLRGLIVCEYSKTSHGCGYYSLERNEYIFDIKNEQYIYKEDGYLVFAPEDGEYLLDYDGNPLVPTEKELNRFGKTDFYYLYGSGYMGGAHIHFYTKDGKELFKGKNLYDSDFEANFKVSKENNLLLREGDQFKEYNIDEQVLYESKEYQNFDFWRDYIVVVDSDRMLKIIDERENVIHEIEQLPDDYFIHWPLSYMDEKDRIYIVVETNEVTNEEKQKYITKDGDDGDYDGFEWGYEYIYDPATGKDSKEVTPIGGYAKPILYLYPEKETKVTVNFEHEDNLTTTYPKFKDEWSVTAKPNGDLYDKDGKYYYGLYWEEDLNHFVDFKEGFYVTKDNAIEFLEEKLSIIGLNDRERNEFIMYWLPILERNGKNLVYFELTEERDSYNKINISPKPDSLLRMAIHVKKVNQKVNIKEEKLTSFTRVGFTAVEWGGVLYN